MWIVSIAVGCRARQTPARSRISRLACDSAIGRSGAFPGSAFFSTTTTSRPAAWSSSASVQPTGPAPRTAMSPGIANRLPLNCLDIRHALRRLDRDHHARRERAPFSGALVVARIVHVQAKPVAGAVHVKALVGFFFQRLVQ